MENRDIVYILKNKSPNDYVELRYSLRTIKNIKYRNVYIVGGLPEWLDCSLAHHIPATDEFRDKQLNALLKITTACHRPEISDDFILMNDDFYLMEPTTVPYLHQGFLKKFIREKQEDYRNSRYWRALGQTAKYFTRPMNYELHFPFVYNKKKFIELAKIYDMSQPHCLRSLYGNHYKVGGQKSIDRKYFNLIDLRNGFRSHDPFLSSGDRCANSLFTRVMSYHIPKRSPYEH